MKRVVVESPFAGDVEENLKYLRAAMHDCLVHRNETPFASHGLYTQPGVLDDTIPEERKLGIEAGFAWRDVAETSVFYVDRGISKGMEFGLQDAAAKRRNIEYRVFMHGYGAGEKSYTVVFEHDWGLDARIPELDLSIGAARGVEEAIEALREQLRARKR